MSGSFSLGKNLKSYLSLGIAVGETVSSGSGSVKESVEVSFEIPAFYKLPPILFLEMTIASSQA